MDEPFGALDLRTRDALTRDYRKLHDQLKLTTVMITHDVIEAVLLADRIAVMQDGRLLGLGTPKALMSDPQNAEVRALMDMPRRQAERLTRADAGRRRGRSSMTLDPAIADAWARLPDYLGAHVLVSLTALAIGLAISLPLALCSRSGGRACARFCSRSPASCRPFRGLRCSRLFYPLLLGTASLTARFLGFDFSALGFLPSVLALALYSMLPVIRNTIAGVEGVDPSLAARRARRRHDRAAIAVHGGIAAGLAGDHGRHPHRRGLGDRHRDAGDADRPDQPRQLHLQRTADAELGVGAVRLRGGGVAGARGRSVAGSGRARRRKPQPGAGDRGARRPRAGGGAGARSRLRARRKHLTSSAPRPSPSNISSPP